MKLQDACLNLPNSMPSSMFWFRTRKILARVAIGSVIPAIALLGLAYAPAGLAVEAASTKSFYASSFSKTPSVAALTTVGRALFFDPSLSASGKIACSGCHDPRFAYGPPLGQGMTRHGRPDPAQAGFRATPSLRYLQAAPPFAEHRFDESGDESVDLGPSGGHMWDGRADNLHDQARLPLLSPSEMANKRPEDVVAKARRATYAAQLRVVFGDDVFDSNERAFKAILLALEVFQQSPSDFYPYSSRYDAWLRGRGKLSNQELRGLEIFNDPRKGNCASCHPSQVRNGAMPQFTDYGYVALGLPRNSAIPANADPRFFDLGLCGPQRKDLSDHAEYCGMFKVPTLRNVAVRQAFFHNGKFSDLERSVQFYAQRDTAPERWYSRSRRTAGVFDDIPPALQANVNRDPPFGRKRGEQPPFSDGEIADVVAFLRALTDADVTVAPAAAKGRRDASPRRPLE
jgi:cytochrome c peroxidase